MKCFLQLLYDIAVRESQLPFEYIGFMDTRRELRKTKGKPLYQKPILWIHDQPKLITGLQKAPGGREYFSTPDSSYAFPVEIEHSDAVMRKARLHINPNVLSKPYISIHKNGTTVAINSDIYDLEKYDLSFFEKLLSLSVHQYQDHYKLLSSGHVISTSAR